MGDLIEARLESSKPPRAYGFKPGVSGNPGGKPKGTKNRLTLMACRRMDEMGFDPLVELIAFARDEKNTADTRLQAIMKLMQYRYTHPNPTAETLDKLIIAEIVGPDKALPIEEAIERERAEKVLENKKSDMVQKMEALTRMMSISTRDGAPLKKNHSGEPPADPRQTPGRAPELATIVTPTGGL